MIDSSTPYQRDWLARLSAGILLGFTLAYGCTWLMVLLSSSMAGNARLMLSMWMFTPVWLVVLGGCFFFSNGRRTWFWLLIANAVVFAFVGLFHVLTN